jgi:SAM-dependent methyltransferase
VTSPAAERNKGPILQILRQWIGEGPCRVLEVGSGTGQHAVYFARRLPQVTWHPSDIGAYLPLVRERVADAALDNLRPPIELNVNAFVDVPGIDVIYSANTLHIMSWDSARVFLREAGARLPPGGLLLMYGPFHVGGRATSDSNAGFDDALRAQDPDMGIRHREQVCIVADRAGLSLQKTHAMPANNQLLVFERRARQAV